MQRESHQLVFMHEAGMSVRTWPVKNLVEVELVRKKYEEGCKNKSVIAAFWYVNGETKQFAFLRA